MRYGTYFEGNTPNFCPQCGRKFVFNENANARNDFFHQASQSCECGIHFIAVYELRDLSERIRKELDFYRI